MKYKIDHDIHIHSLVSPCSRDEKQTKEAILAYALTNNYRLAGISDHYWPDTKDIIWDSLENLPQSNKCSLLKGAEIDMDMQCGLLIEENQFDDLDYFILAINHIHLVGYSTPKEKWPMNNAQGKAYIDQRLETALSMNLPFERVGLAHYTWIPLPNCSLKDYLAQYTDDEFKGIFSKIAKLGMGVELNFNPFIDEETLNQVLRPYRIAKEQGCKFYLGGDAHHPENFCNCYSKFEKIIDLLELTEVDKWDFVKKNLA